MNAVVNWTEWDVKCRNEDMQQRALENERRRIEDARREMDEKAQQLKTIANQSALIAGFCMVIIVEVQIPEDIHSALLISFSCTTALVVSLMLISMLNATFLLVAILRYDTVQRPIPFQQFWHNRCENDWKRAMRAFVFGVPLFCLVLAQIGWVKYYNSYNAWIWASASMTVIALVTIVMYSIHTDRKWRDWLLSNQELVVLVSDSNHSQGASHDSEEKVELNL